MLCPGEKATVRTFAPAGHAEHEMHAGHDMEAHHTAAHDHSHRDASDESSSGGHATVCQFCAGGCCVTPLAFAPPSVQSPRVTASAADGHHFRLTAHATTAATTTTSRASPQIPP